MFHFWIPAVRLKDLCETTSVSMSGGQYVLISLGQLSVFHKNDS